MLRILGYRRGVEPQPSSAVLLERLAAGDEEAAETLFGMLYGELHDLARRIMARERAGHTLQTTALLHEAWLRLAGDTDTPYQDDKHFVRLAARAMRRVLVDHARKRKAAKRQAHRTEPLVDDALVVWERGPHDLIDLDEALERLGAQDETLRQVVELRFFAGLTLEKTGAVLGMPLGRTYKAWLFARAWLKRELERGARNE